MAPTDDNDQAPGSMPTLEDYLRAVQQYGIDPVQLVELARKIAGDPQRFSDLARKLLESDPVATKPDDSVEGEEEVPAFENANVPGFEYLQRVSSAAGRAVAAQVEQMNNDWSKMRDGDYSFAKAMNSWARIVESYYGVVTEAWRGPAEFPRPAWLIIPYSKSKRRAPTISVRVDAIFDKRTSLEYTKFEGLGNAQSTDSMYAQAPEGVGTRVEMRLNHKAIQILQDDTDHVGLIFRKAVGAAPPLLIVVVHVTA
jgi:hypothetical protein